MEIEKNWILKSKSDDIETKPLMEALNIPKPLASLLIQRNINSLEQADAFFNPKLSDLHDPFLMKDMEIAVERKIFLSMVIMMLMVPLLLH